jgi:Na+-driven multidrug efflux pump
MAFPRLFAMIFTSDATLLEHIIVPARIYVACLGLFGIQVACQQTFTAIGDAPSSLLAAVMRKFILLIPLIYLVPALWKSNQEYAVYLAEPIADLLAITFTATLFYFRSKKALAKMDAAEDGQESQKSQG